MTVPAKAREMISKLIGMLGSDHDGEALNAARLLKRRMEGEGVSFGDLANIVREGGESSGPRVVVVDTPARPNPGAETAQKIIDKAQHRLSQGERRFLDSIIFRSSDYYGLTMAQANWLSDLHHRFCSPPPPPRKPRKKPGPVPPEILEELGLTDSPKPASNRPRKKGWQHPKYDVSFDTGLDDTPFFED